MEFRKINEYNRRQVDILITKDGLDLLASIDIVMDKILDKYNNLTEEEAIQLNKLLDKLNS